jgi:hypothetical protein
MINFAKKIIPTIIVLSIIFHPVSVVYATDNIRPVAGGTNVVEQVGDVALKSAQGVGTCLAAGSVANFLASQTLGLLGELGNKIAESLGFIQQAAANLGPKVPVENKVLELTNEKIEKNSKKVAEKEVATGILDIIPAMDAIAYCLVNEVIRYVADSTITWIEGGFEGKPVYVSDTNKLFQDILSQELDGTINEIGNGILCEEFQVNIQLSLLESKRDRLLPVCTWDRAKDNVSNFINNDTFNFDLWERYTLNPNNNPLGAYLKSSIVANDRIDSKEKRILLELDWGNGFWSWQGANGSVTTPGSIVQSKVERALNLPEDRLVLADEFNEVITVLVNELIKTAVHEIFD